MYSVWRTSRTAPLTAPTKVADRAAYTDQTITVTVPGGTAASLDLD